MKPTKSKRQERQEIAHQIDHFLQAGGHVDTVAPGISGREPGSYYYAPPISFQQDKDPRTPVVDAIKAIESRRRPSKPSHNRKPRSPRRVLIKDDFGEPLRWSWRD